VYSIKSWLHILLSMYHLDGHVVDPVGAVHPQQQLLAAPQRVRPAVVHLRRSDQRTRASATNTHTSMYHEHIDNTDAQQQEVEAGQKKTLALALDLCAPSRSHRTPALARPAALLNVPPSQPATGCAAQCVAVTAEPHNMHDTHREGLTY
jgi:hypothetical protein